MARASHPVRDIIERLDQMAAAETVTLGELLEAFGLASFVPALMIPAVLVVSPLSGIPLFSSICGLTIALIAGQMFLGRRHLWLPAWVKTRTINGDRLHRAMDRMTGLANFVDRISRDRFRLLVTTPGNRIPQAMCLTSGGAMPFLELVPFSSSLLGMAVLCCATAFLARDGVFVFAGAAFMGIAALVPVYVLWPLLT